MPKVYRPIAGTPVAPAAAAFVASPSGVAFEAMEDLALAMRLNVELCDASEAVEKLDYRWKMVETEKGKWEEQQCLFSCSDLEVYLCLSYLY
jgi:hypothetical protein